LAVHLKIASLALKATLGGSIKVAKNIKASGAGCI
jgi:hypothetical protein